MAVACQPSIIPGLEVRDNDGNVSRLSREASESPELINPLKPARFMLEKPMQVEVDNDISIILKGAGPISVSASTGGKNPLLLARGTFVLTEGRTTEFRVHTTASGTLETLEISAGDGGEARLLGLLVQPAFYGFNMDADAYIVDSTTLIEGSVGGLPRSITHTTIIKGASLLIGTVTNGSIDILARDARGTVIASYRALMGTDRLVAIPISALETAASLQLVSATGIKSAVMTPGDGAPLSDLYAILATSAGNGPYSLYRWDIIPETLVFDFKNYEVQDRYLKRLAFFAEKPGFRGRLALDAEIAAFHGWNAHDYSADTLSAFYSRAMLTGFKLNAEELELFALLQKYGIIEKDASGAFKAGKGAIVSISRESSSSLRRTFIDHESSHALFFQDAGYRNLASALWAGLGRESKRYWISHFNWRRYDTSDEYLCINELQAYLVQQALGALDPYYESVTMRLVSAYPSQADIIESDAAFAMRDIRLSAARLDGYLQDRWGLEAGRFGRVQARPVP
jgi:hypothetical protein